MDYCYAKFDDCNFGHFGFIMLTNSQTESHTDADDRYTYMTTISVSKN